MLKIYRALLRLYPKSFRSAFEGEITATLARVESDRANRGPIDRILLSGRELAGLLIGVVVQRLGLARCGAEIPAVAAGSACGTQNSDLDEIAEVERSIRFHLAKTIDCIAHHRFEGARLHAREEARAREQLIELRRREADRGNGSGNFAD